MSEREARALVKLVAWEAPELELCGEVWPAQPPTGESGFMVWDPARELHLVIRSPQEWRWHRRQREGGVRR